MDSTQKESSLPKSKGAELYNSGETFFLPDKYQPQFMNYQLMGDTVAVMLWHSTETEADSSFPFSKDCCNSFWDMKALLSNLQKNALIARRVLLSVGYKECKTKGFEVQTCLSTLKSIVDTLRSKGAVEIILTNVPPCLAASQKLIHWKCLEAMNRAMKNYTDECPDLILCDIFDLFCKPINFKRKHEYVIQSRPNYVINYDMYNDTSISGRVDRVTFSKKGKKILSDHVQKLVDFRMDIFLTNLINSKILKTTTENKDKNHADSAADILNTSIRSEADMDISPTNSPASKHSSHNTTSTSASPSNSLSSTNKTDNPNDPNVPYENAVETENIPLPDLGKNTNSELISKQETTSKKTSDGNEKHISEGNHKSTLGTVTNQNSTSNGSVLKLSEQACINSKKPEIRTDSVRANRTNSNVKQTNKPDLQTEYENLMIDIINIENKINRDTKIDKFSSERCNKPDLQTEYEKLLTDIKNIENKMKHNTNRNKPSFKRRYAQTNAKQSHEPRKLQHSITKPMKFKKPYSKPFTDLNSVRYDLKNVSDETHKKVNDRLQITAKTNRRKRSSEIISWRKEKVMKLDTESSATCKVNGKDILWKLDSCVKTEITSPSDPHVKTTINPPSDPRVKTAMKLDPRVKTAIKSPSDPRVKTAVKSPSDPHVKTAITSPSDPRSKTAIKSPSEQSLEMNNEMKKELFQKPASVRDEKPVEVNKNSRGSTKPPRTRKEVFFQHDFCCNCEICYKGHNNLLNQFHDLIKTLKKEVEEDV